MAPFAAFLLLLAATPYVPGGIAVTYPLRVMVVTAVLWIWSRGVVEWRPSRRGLPSVMVGVAVFLIWIGPDLLWPGYRSHWVFTNSITGAVSTATPGAEQRSLFFLFFRVAGSALLVPVVEELFWRAWLMRYLISRDFRSVALGAWTASSFWIGAALFASEHGPYWDVGLAAGAVYNWWMIRTRSLADCILAHAVTNGCLAVYVLTADKWQYWL